MFVFLGFPLNIVLLSALITLGFYLAFIPGVGYLFNLLESFEIKGLGKVFPAKVTGFIANRLTLPGVILHESAHAIIAFLTGAQVTDMSFLDVFKQGMLGHVDFVTNGSKLRQSLQLSLISCAPVLFGCGYLVLSVMVLWGFCSVWWHYALVIYLGVSVVNHLSMSGADLKLYFKGIVFTCIVSFVIIFVILLLYFMK